jgi:hypothetical protein
MRGHNPGVKPWLAWVWRPQGHESPRIWAWPRSVHKARKADLTRRIDKEPLDLRCLARAVGAIILYAGAVWARSLRRAGGH